MKRNIVCSKCLWKIEIGNYLFLRRIYTNYLKCSKCKKLLAGYEIFFNGKALQNLSSVEVNQK